MTPGELLRVEVINQGMDEQLERGRTMPQDVGSLASCRGTCEAPAASPACCARLLGARQHPRDL